MIAASYDAGRFLPGHSPANLSPVALPESCRWKIFWLYGPTKWRSLEGETQSTQAEPSTGTEKSRIRYKKMEHRTRTIESVMQEGRANEEPGVDVRKRIALPSRTLSCRSQASSLSLGINSGLSGQACWPSLLAWNPIQGHSSRTFSERVNGRCLLADRCSDHSTRHPFSRKCR